MLTVKPKRPARIRWKPGSLVAGRYIIQRLVGAGGMGVVAVADDLFLCKQVAMKALRPSVARDPQNVERFRREVALAQSVTHKNIARTYDLGEAQGVHFFSMEYIEGESLSRRLRDAKTLPADEVRELAIRICRALSAAHEAKVVHRDLKPSNVMLVDDERKLVVLDFGISGNVQDGAEDDAAKSDTREEEGAEDQTAEKPSGADAPDLAPDLVIDEFDGPDWDVTSAGMGTPKYMSPEQWLGENVGPQSDLYALGAIMFQCLAGRPPFQGEHDDYYASAHVTEEPPRLRSIDASIPKGLDRIVARCLAKYPKDRFDSAEALEEALDRVGRLPPWVFLVSQILITGLVLAGLGYGILQFAERAIVLEMRPAVARLAHIASEGLTVEDLDLIHSPSDMNHPAFERVYSHLNDIYVANPEVLYVYAWRRRPVELEWEFVVDQDPFPAEEDGNGVIDAPNERPSVPGRIYEDGLPEMDATLTTGLAQSDPDFTWDAWALTLSGYARVGEHAGPGGYIVGVDVGNQRLTLFRKLIIVTLLLVWPILVALPRYFEFRARKRLEAKGSA